uniref:glycoside hydrolase domain-containing protein n=1 Tax=Nonomuraea bangladeshensis TaxID=404385 RepID=UPI003F499C7C
MNALRTLSALVVLAASALLAISSPAAHGSAFGTGVWTESAYTSVFPDSRPSADADTTLRLDTARNEFEGGQIVLRRPDTYTINKVRFTDLLSGQDRLDAANLTYNFVEYVHLNANTIFGGNQWISPVTRKAPGAFPDRLLNDASLQVKEANATRPIWVRAYIPKSTPGGLYKGVATVETTAGEMSVPIEINVRPVTLPDARDSAFTNVLWTLFFGDLSHEEYEVETIKKFYGIDRYSADWWTLMDNVAKVMKEHRTNNLTLPMINFLRDGGTYLDASGRYHFNWSRFDQVVEFFLARGGIKRLEGFWTNGGPGYWSKWDVQIIDAAGKRAWVDWDSPEAARWIDQYIPALKAHLAEKGWTDRWWMHVGDEPQGDHGQAAWNGIATKVRSHWPGVRLGDAAFHEPWASRLAEKADILIPNELNYNIDPTTYDAERAKGKELWLYNCNIPVGNYLNRFLDQPHWNQRLTMWWAFSRKATGYLHWAYNNWQYTMDQQEQKGDGILVWPDPTRKTIESSIRYESLRDGIEDWEVLNLAKANDLATALIQDADTYTPDTAYMQRVRRIALDLAAGKSLPDRARTATATASSGNAAAAIDGDPATVWQPSGNGWLRLDLGRQTQIDLVRLTWNGDATHKLLVSYDGNSWTPTAGNNVKGRYLRVETSGGLRGIEVAGSALATANLAGGRPYTLSEPPSRFPDSGRESTDGVLADAWDDGRTYGYNLDLGQSKKVEMTIDLGSVHLVDNAKVHAYEEYPAYRPDTVTVFTSVDGKRFAQRAVQPSANGTSGIWYDLRFLAAPARYVKVAFAKTRSSAEAEAMLIDEVEIYGAEQPANLAWGRPYTKSAQPDPAYADSGLESTDGLGAGAYMDGLGYGYRLAAGEQKTVDVTIDLGAARRVSNVRVARFDDGAHDYAPDSVKVLTGSVERATTTLPDGRWYDLSFDPVSTRYVTVRMSKRHGYFADYLFLDDIAVFGDRGPSLFKNYTIPESEPAYPDAGAESADGQLAGHYGDGLSYGYHLASGATRTIELIADLGDQRTISAVSLRAYDDGVHHYRPDQVVVLTSSNGTDFTERARTATAPARWFDLDFAGVSARYVKVAVTKTEASFADYIFLDEVTVHGS